MIKVKPDDPAEIDELLTAAAVRRSRSRATLSQATPS